MKLLKFIFVLFVVGCTYNAFAQKAKVSVDIKQSREKQLENLRKEYEDYQSKGTQLKSVVDNLNAIVISDK